MAVYGVAFKFDSIVELLNYLDRIEADFGDIKIKEICKFKNNQLESDNYERTKR